MAKKLTEIVKKRILEGFCSGKSLTSLSKEYGCTPGTITRAVKSFLTEEEYVEIKGKRGKFSSSKLTNAKDQIDPSKEILESLSSNDLSNINSLDPNDLDGNIETKYSSTNSDEFFEIAPLNFDEFPEEQKEVSCIPLDSFPWPQKIVYMLIDKKTEIESKPLKDFAEWTFLSEKEKARLAISLYSSQRVAKRNCSRNQRVLKIPDSKVFSISSSYLLAKGITRLIMDDSLISLDS